jgi:hypothetical protein
MVEVEQSAETRATLDGPGDRVVIARHRDGPDEATVQPLVVSTGEIMVDE